MNRFFTLSLFVCALVLLSACQTTTDIEISNTSTPEITGEVPIRAIPVDVVSDYVAVSGITPQAVSIAQGNLFDNGGFESGLTGWTGCSAGAIEESAYANEGSKALKVNAGNCFYRSVEVSVSQDLFLSCFARLESGNGWTGMGLGFADANWATIPGGPSTLITGNSYQRYDVETTAPAGSKYVSMWMYSDNPMLVDDCSLMLEQEPPPPPPVQGEELLENSRLDGTAEWSLGCGGTATVVNVGRSGGSRALALEDGACLDQSLSASDIALLKGQDFTFTCQGAKPNENSYAAMSIFFDDTLLSEAFPYAPSGLYGPTPDTLEITGTAPSNFSSAFVSLYANDSLVAYSCSLKVDGGEPQPPEPPAGGENILVNGDFETSLTGTWAASCGRRWSLPDGHNGKGVYISEACNIDQSFDVAALAGNEYSFSCYVKNPIGYASLSIFFDGTPISKVVPVSNDYQLVEITGTAPNAGYGFISIYTNSQMNVDDCVLATAGGQPPVQPGTQQWFDRFGEPNVSENFYRATNESVKALELTNGGVITVNSIIPSGNTDPNGEREINIRKYSNDGELIFSKSELLSRSITLNDRATISVSLVDATVDSLGNVYVLESAVQSFSVARRGQTDVYIHKFSAFGDRVWERLIRSQEYSIDPRAQGQTVPRYENIAFSSNALYLAGKDGGTIVKKLTLAAIEQWTSQIDTGEFFLFQDFVTNNNGDVYISAFSYNNSGSVQLTKLNSAGNQQWQRSVTNSRSGSGLVADDSSVYILGSTGNVLVEAENDRSDGYIWKYDNVGNLVWTSQYASNLIDTITKGAIYNSSLYVTGTNTTEIRDASNFFVSANTTGFIKQIDTSSATELWSTEIDIENSNIFADIAVDSTGIYAGGYIEGPTERLDGDLVTNSSDAFVTKYSLP